MWDTNWHTALPCQEYLQQYCVKNSKFKIVTTARPNQMPATNALHQITWIQLISDLNISSQTHNPPLPAVQATTPVMNYDLQGCYDQKGKAKGFELPSPRNTYRAYLHSNKYAV
jgi:hypothetical protein